MSPADSLDAKALRAALSGQLIGHHVVQLAEASSTNDVVAQMAAAHPEGLVVLAEKQTAGRGQYGRRWESAPGLGLWFSILLRPQLTPEESPRLTSWAADCLAATIREECGLPARVKPPNDVYVGDRKVAGLLLEMRAVVGEAHYGILGIGLNVNQAAEDFPENLRRERCLARDAARTDAGPAAARARAPAESQPQLRCGETRSLIRTPLAGRAVSPARARSRSAAGPAKSPRPYRAPDRTRQSPRPHSPPPGRASLPAFRRSKSR